MSVIRRTWVLTSAAAVVLILGAAAAVVLLPRVLDKGPHRSNSWRVGAGTTPPRPAVVPSVTTSPVTADCTYLPASAGDALGRTPPLPAAHPTLAASTRVVLHTDAGDVSLDLAGDRAPCTVNSFISLVRAHFYDDTPCHRLTTSALYVLQCGDPSGTGSGGPGYAFPDENLPPGNSYPRGTVAMANAGPATNGSQFFLVYRQSTIDPNYPVLGSITAGLDVLDRVADAGTDEANGPGDGHPNQGVMIMSVELATAW
jgi:peptidyl-prolyl cis-trans isomerase B (cyclophilin B)